MPYLGFEPRASCTPDRWRTNQLHNTRLAYCNSHFLSLWHGVIVDVTLWCRRLQLRSALPLSAILHRLHTAGTHITPSQRVAWLKHSRRQAPHVDPLCRKQLRGHIDAGGRAEILASWRDVTRSANRTKTGRRGGEAGSGDDQSVVVRLNRVLNESRSSRMNRRLHKLQLPLLAVSAGPLTTQLVIITADNSPRSNFRSLIVFLPALRALSNPAANASRGHVFDPCGLPYFSKDGPPARMHRAGGADNDIAPLEQLAVSLKVAPPSTTGGCEINYQNRTESVTKRAGGGRRYSVVVRLVAFHLGEPSSISGEVTPEFLQVGIVPDDGAGRRVFSGISRFPHTFIPAPLHTHLALPSSALTTSIDGIDRGVQCVLNWRFAVNSHWMEGVRTPPRTSPKKLTAPISHPLQNLNTSWQFAPHPSPSSGASLVASDPYSTHGRRVALISSHVGNVTDKSLFKLSATVGHTGSAALKHVATHVCKGVSGVMLSSLVSSGVAYTSVLMWSRSNKSGGVSVVAMLCGLPYLATGSGSACRGAGEPQRRIEAGPCPGDTTSPHEHLKELPPSIPVTRPAGTCVVLSGQQFEWHPVKYGVLQDPYRVLEDATQVARGDLIHLARRYLAITWVRAHLFVTVGILLAGTVLIPGEISDRSNHDRPSPCRHDSGTRPSSGRSWGDKLIPLRNAGRKSQKRDATLQHEVACIYIQGRLVEAYGRTAKQQFNNTDKQKWP
ncbi:hypothetical protein PR048_000782 [Dryococelus australis]|uniref:Uncharacterized protein n=1 Tax=Dryococelus australis TaxID=614101 RepID=A0ABQ9IGU2_9NEOP|nr:hypothetical protein PR048_000782 [Dryococelus australis]